MTRIISFFLYHFVMLNSFDFSPFGRRPLVQHLSINCQILKQVQDDHAAHGLTRLRPSSLCHAELVSASGYWSLQILKQVIRYAHRKSYLIS